jgi:O-acetyl-ADP-ribose deacetylase (regulator of RNase III)
MERPAPASGLTVVSGDLFASGAAALVNPVNTVGVMGKGLALEFKARWPAMFTEYAQQCRSGRLAPGTVHGWQAPACGTWIVNVPTKRHWRDPSRLTDVTAGIAALARWIDEIRPPSVAVPALGCGLGGLPWETVRIETEAGLHDVARHTVVRLYQPG